MLRPNHKLLFVIILINFLLSSCGYEAALESKDIRDFSSTKVISQSEAFANGTDESILKLQFFDIYGKPLSNLKINTTELPAGITSKGCTASDETGISTCTFKSTTAGTLQIKIYNGDLFYETTLTFKSVSQQSQSKPTQTVSSDVVKQNMFNYSITSTVIDNTGNIQIEENYTVTTGVQTSNVDSL